MRLVDDLVHDFGLDLPRLPPGRSGDPGVFGPDSIVWRIARERLLLLAGPAALLMQLAHPLVAAGVADHSGFRRDPFARLRDTLAATLTISFGDSEQAQRAAAGVRTTHRRVRGRLPHPVGSFQAGAPYDAADPDLALWVHATLIEAALGAYHHLVRPLTEGDRARYVDEVTRFGELFGVTHDVMPPAYGDFRAYVEAMVDGPALAVGPDGHELGLAVLDPPVSAVVRPSRPVVRVVTAGLLPDRLRDAFGLVWGPKERAAFRGIGAASRAAVPMLPPGLRFWTHARVAVRRMAMA